MSSRHVVLVLACLLLGSSVFTLFPEVRASTYTSHAPIVINGNVDFTAENGVTRGTGVASDPYVIEGWNISSRAFFGPAAIQINNTNAYFIVRDIYSNDAANPGVVFANVTNGVFEDSYVFAYPHSLSVISSRNIRAYNDTIWYFATI